MQPSRYGESFALRSAFAFGGVDEVEHGSLRERRAPTTMGSLENLYRLAQRFNLALVLPPSNSRVRVQMLVDSGRCFALLTGHSRVQMT